MASQSGSEGEEPIFLDVSLPEYEAQFSVEGWCPVQAFGTVKDRDLYFRGRHDSWSFEVADSSGVLPSDGGTGAGSFYREARFANAGRMPKKIVIEFIRQCLSDYFASSA